MEDSECKGPYGSRRSPYGSRRGPYGSRRAPYNRSVQYSNGRSERSVRFPEISVWLCPDVHLDIRMDDDLQTLLHMRIIYARPYGRLHRLLYGCPCRGTARSLRALPDHCESFRAKTERLNRHDRICAALSPQRITKTQCAPFAKKTQCPTVPEQCPSSAQDSAQDPSQLVIRGRICTISTHTQCHAQRIR